MRKVQTCNELNVENQNDFLRLTKVWLIVVDAIFISSKDILHFFTTKNIEQIMLCSYCEKKSLWSA